MPQSADLQNQFFGSLLAIEYILLMIDPKRLDEAIDCIELLPVEAQLDVEEIFRELRETGYRWNYPFCGPGLSEEDHAEYTAALTELDVILTPFFEGRKGDITDY